MSSFSETAEAAADLGLHNEFDAAVFDNRADIAVLKIVGTSSIASLLVEGVVHFNNAHVAPNVTGSTQTAGTHEVARFDHDALHVSLGGVGVSAILIAAMVARSRRRASQFRTRIATGYPGTSPNDR